MSPKSSRPTTDTLLSADAVELALRSDPEIGEREYDLTSRHVLVGRLLRNLCASGPILDIGGSAGLTGFVLSDHRVITVDIRDTDVDVVASGGDLPFADKTFVAAIALDVLEHVPDGIKERLIEEAARVASLVILAGPYDDPQVNLAEKQQREIFEALFAYEHPWLAEHAACGLPSLERTTKQLNDLGFTVEVFGSNPLSLWSAQLANTHIALRTGLDEPAKPLRRWLLSEFLDRADSTPPSYRHIVVGASGDTDISMVSKLTPAGNEELTADAVARTEIATAAVIANGLGVLEGIRDDAMEGWADSVRTIRRQEAVSAVAQECENLVQDTGAWHALVEGPPLQAHPPWNSMPDQEVYERWLRSRHIVEPPTAGPMFSIVTPVFNPPAEFLTECIRSVRNQTYTRWELILVDVSDAPHVVPICARFASLDDRIKIVRRDNEGIAANSNAGVAASKGEWIVFLDHDDTIESHALAALARRIDDAPGTDFIYSDEDKIGPRGGYVEPFFKPDWSPDLLRSINYITHLTAVERSLFDRVGGIRSGFDGAQDFDFVLRATADAKEIQHIADVLYHWRQHAGSTASDVRFKPDAHYAGRRALRDFLADNETSASVGLGPGATVHRVRYPMRPELVSIIVPYRDKAELTEACLTAIAANLSELPVEVLVVSNGSEEAQTAKALQRWKASWPWVRSLDFDHPFNFQRLNNWAAHHASGELLLFLNNDTQPMHPGWLEAMAEHAQRTEVGAVGGRLFYPDGVVQHAGVAVGIGGFAEHPWSHLHPDCVTPAGPSYWIRNVLAVTGACLMVAHEKFDAIGGFDERFMVCGGDVDLCLRLHQRGLWNVMTPYCRVIHHESATRLVHPPDNDIRQSLISYAPYLSGFDPFYNQNLTRADTSCRLAEPASI